MVRDGANTIGIDDLKTTRFVGDIWNDDVLREAMAGCDVVYYCVVDTRGWLQGPGAAVPHQRRGHPKRAGGRQRMPASSASSSPAAT